MKKTIRATSLAALLIVGGGAVLAADTTPDVVRAEILRTDVGSGLEAVLGRTTMKVGADTGRHIHPGTELVTLAEGTVELVIDGQPPRTINAGEGFMIPFKAVHRLRNIGNGPAVFTPVWIIEKGQPVTIFVK